MQRYLVFLVACSLPLLFIGQIAPNMARELDFWLLWLVAMVLVGLPVLFAEFALSARSEQAPWQGMQKLTREADAGIIWRAFAGLSVLVAILITAHLSGRIATGAITYLPELKSAEIPLAGLAAGTAVLALILSLLKLRLLPVGVLLLVIGAGISLFDSDVSVPVFTTVSIGEWTRAVVLALLSVGAGTGLYWFGSTSLAPQLMAAKRSLAGLILPIWLTQLIFGAFALLASSAMVTPLSFIVTSLGMLLIAAFLMYYAGAQLISRFGMMVGAIMAVVLVLIASVVPPVIILWLLVAISLIAVLMLSVFSGFIMKISHLRKTLNFNSELRYNLWRVLVRIIVPVAVLAGLAGIVIELIGR